MISRSACGQGVLPCGVLADGRGTGVQVSNESVEQEVAAIPEPKVYRVHWFHPDRPVEGTVYVRPANAPELSGDGDEGLGG